MDVCIVLTTTPSSESAEKIGRALVEGGLAACVNIVGKIRSIYRWKGEIVDGEEYMAIIKTRRELLLRVEDKIKALHPYELPEIISLPVDWGNSDYLRWVEDSTKG